MPEIEIAMTQAQRHAREADDCGARQQALRDKMLRDGQDPAEVEMALVAFLQTLQLMQQQLGRERRLVSD